MIQNVSRRTFLRSTGSLVVSFSAAQVLGPLAFGQKTPAAAPAPGPFDTHASHIDGAKLDNWIAVNADGTITAHTGKCDFGQGMFTAQTQLVAEELCVPLASVKMIECDTDITPDQGTTSGSQSTATNFRNRNLAQAAATAREALVAMASEKLGVPVEQLTVNDGVVTAKDGKHVSYAELVGGKQFDLVISTTAKRRLPSEWKIMGTPVQSLDRMQLMTGTYPFVHTVHVPGMVHGRVVRPAEHGATLASVDEDSVKGMPGLIKIVVRKNFVGVVAEKQFQAVQIVKKLKVNWNPGPGLPPQKDFYDFLRKQVSRDQMLVDSKDVDDKLGSAKQVIKSTYHYPYNAHGSIGSSCAIADIQTDRATIWSPTQSAYPTRHSVSVLTGLPLDSVHVMFVRGAGCYGLNGADAVSMDAAIMSQAVGRPVRVQLTRQDEFITENYGAACIIDQKVGVDDKGAIAAWDVEMWNASYGGRPEYQKPGNVITGALVGLQPDTITAKAAAEPSGPLRNNSNAVPSYLAGKIGGKADGAGNVSSERVLVHTSHSPLFVGPLRSPLRLQNTFAHEGMFDEVCAAVKADPVAYRLQYLSDERVADCVKAAAKAAKWDTRPSPKPGNAHTGVVTGRGMACVAYEGDNGFAALVAEVEVDQATGKVQATRFTIAHDCGPISNPDGVRSQVQGGLLQGMSRAMGEEITWDDRKVTSVDWLSYHSLYLGFRAPEIDIILLNKPDLTATGAGETGITLSCAALGNAIFDATGVRLREAPFTPKRILAALAERNTKV